LLWLTGKGSVILLIPAILSLIVFVYLLTLHPAASGRVYATYGAVYIATAIIWLWSVDGIKPVWSDWFGVALHHHITPAAGSYRPMQLNQGFPDLTNSPVAEEVQDA
jgi:drug/metabolite transporter superfamily protein YnfA